MCAGLSARPFFAARHEVCCSLCAWRRTAGTRGSGACGRWPPLGDRFLMDYYLRPLEGGPPSCRMPGRAPRAPPKSVPLAAP